MLLAALSFIFWVIGIIFVALGTFVVWYGRRMKGNETPKVYKAVSILKPVKGAEDGLRQNLETFFQLDYPVYELIFSVADPHDPAREIIEGLIKSYPSVDAKIVVASSNIGKNPKVNNLFISYRIAKHDLLLISDSNIRAKRDYLKILVSYMKPGVSLVTTVLKGVNPKTLGGALEENYMNTFLARTLHLGQVLGHPIVLGKSMLFRRTMLNRCGGIEVLKNQVAEDYATGILMQAHGLKVALMTEPVDQHLADFTFRSFWSRHIRWGRIRKAISFFTFIIEPVSTAVGSGIAGAVAFQTFFGMNPLVVFLTHLAVWCALDQFVRFDGGEKISAKSVVNWLLFELCTLPLWIHTMMGSKVNWRGNWLKIDSGGRLNPNPNLDADEYRMEPIADENPAFLETQEIPISLLR